jgi:hypothetical protein
MSSNNNIDELKAESDRAEHEYQAAMRVRRDAVQASQAALKAAARARSRYMRALGQQVEAGADA